MNAPQGSQGRFLVANLELITEADGRGYSSRLRLDGNQKISLAGNYYNYWLLDPEVSIFMLKCFDFLVYGFAICSAGFIGTEIPSLQQIVCEVIIIITVINI